jgi:hypothetical protein
VLCGAGPNLSANVCANEHNRGVLLAYLGSNGCSNERQRDLVADGCANEQQQWN